MTSGNVFPCYRFYSNVLYESKCHFHIAKSRRSIAPLYWMLLLHVYVIEVLSKVPSGRFMYSYYSIKRWILYSSQPGALGNIGYPSEMHLKLKSREVSFVHSWFCNCQIVLTFCTKYDSSTLILCKFQNDWTIARDFMDKRGFARFEFNMCFGPIY